MSRSRVELFVLRARRVLAHSLMSDTEQLEKLRRGDIYVSITADQSTGEKSSRMVVDYYPDEEILESLAARLRPILLDKDDIHYAKVLREVEGLTEQEKVAELVEPIHWWIEQWEDVYSKDSAKASGLTAVQAYGLVTEDGSYSDRFLMDRWLYGDLVHADDLSEKTVGTSLADRYRAAAHLVARLAEILERTYFMLAALHENGLIELNPEVFDEQVVVGDASIDAQAEVYEAPLGATPPPDLEPFGPGWRNVADIYGPSASENGLGE